MQEIGGHKININSRNAVTFFQYSLYDAEGANYYFSDIDLELIERVKI